MRHFFFAKKNSKFVFRDGRRLKASERRRQPRWQDVFEVSAASHSLCLHSLAHAPWQQLGSMCARAFCVPKFEVATAPRELWAALLGFFCAIEMPAARALPAILFASIALPMRHGSS
jgi:hypothetical protein